MDEYRFSRRYSLYMAPFFRIELLNYLNEGLGK
jgi:hypothetical protein